MKMFHHNVFHRALVAGFVAILACAALPRARGLTVYGEAHSTGPTVSVNVFADLGSTAILSFSVTVFYDPAILRVVEAHSNGALWYFHDGEQPLEYQSAETSQPGRVLLLGGRFDGRNPDTAVSGNHVLLGTVVFDRLNPEVPDFRIQIGRGGAYANFVTTEGAVLDALPGEVVFQEVEPNPKDLDLDGLADLWEKEHFGDPRSSYYSDDPDRDNVNNLDEQKLGSDPKNPVSNLRLQWTRKGHTLILQWNSAEARVYAIEASEDLRRFRPLIESIEATPPSNEVELDVLGDDGPAFYRVVLIDYPGF